MRSVPPPFSRTHLWHLRAFRGLIVEGFFHCRNSAVPGHVLRSSNHRLRYRGVKFIVFSILTPMQGLIESGMRPDDGLLLFLLGRCVLGRIKSRRNA